MKFSYLFVFTLISSWVYAQQTNDAVLMTLDGKPVYASEFKQVYRKNLDLVADDVQKDISTYLDLFKNYKLKLAAAEEMGLQERPDLKKELQVYKDQLAETYMAESPVTEALVQEAYERTLNEVKASHIMLRLAENSSPQDTLQAYRKISQLQQELLNGADFEELARTHSEDPSVAQNGGDVGWFKAFKMVYPFEQAAYTTKIGDFSPIIRSKYGYHLLKVTGKRKSRGAVSVAHIMLSHNDRTVNNQERRIYELYKELEEGASFDLLARKYSDDHKSAIRGGQLEPFVAGSLSSPEFEEQAFALKDSGAISKPFKSAVGWHIIQLKNKKPVASLEELRPGLIKQIEQDSRSRLVDEALQAKLEKELDLWENNQILQKLGENRSKSAEIRVKTPLFAALNDTLYTTNFQTYISKNSSISYDSLSNARIDQAYKKFKTESLKELYKKHLASTNEEYQQITQEYRDGILLFALMEERIWNVAREDSTGLKKFFENNKEVYKTQEQYDLDILYLPTAATAKTARKLLKRKTTLAQVKDSLNKQNTNAVYSSSLIVGPDNALLPAGYEPKLGVSKVFENEDNYSLIILQKIIPAGKVSLNDVRGRVMSDYQDHLEENWLKELKNEHVLKLNQEVFNQVEKELSR